jgi:hypothetical protein
LVKWRKEVEQTISGLGPGICDHVADVGEVRPENTESQARLLIQRMRDVLNVCASR